MRSLVFNEKLFCGYLENPDSCIDPCGVCVYLQPQISLSTGRTIGAEALVRFKDPSGKILPPGKFLPTVDRLGLHDALLLAVLRRTGMALQEAGASLPQNFRVAVNVDASSINWHLPRHLRNYLSRAGLRPEALAVELTETAILHDMENSIAVLSAVRDLGIAVYIDDFGTGYSCLSCLQKLPVNGVKIPRDFVRHCNRDKDLKIIVSLCDMLKHLNIKTIAEGIETAKQRSLLEVIGCDYGQGFLFSPPVPPAEFVKFL